MTADRTVRHSFIGGNRPFGDTTLPPSDQGRSPTALEEASDKPRGAPRKSAPPDATCASCGTSVPWNETECAFCLLEKLPKTGRRTLLLHWLVFLVAMGIVLGGGALLAQ